MEEIMRKSVLLLIFFLFACAQNNQQAEVQKFGGEITLNEMVSLDQVMQEPDKYLGSEVKVSGTVTDVCEKKGCWIKLKDGDNEITVRFKDYAFFVPTDVVNAQVTVQGIIEVAQNDHIMQEANKHSADSTASAEVQYAFTANAVELIPAPKAAEQQNI